VPPSAALSVPGVGGVRLGAVEGSSLGDVQLFAGLADDDLDLIAALGRSVQVPEGEVVMRQGDDAEECFVVVDGTAGVLVDGVRVRTAAPGESIGEMGMLDGSPRSASVVADGPMHLLAFGADAFRSLLDAVPVVRERMTTDLAGRLRKASNFWLQLAGDADLLLGALLDLQASPDPDVRQQARAQAARVVALAAPHEPDAPAVRRAGGRDPFLLLTPAERRVSELVAEGLSNPGIAEQLVVSRHTVESHLKHVFAKLGIRTRVELAAAVLRRR
jgi:CRP/FNR family transcriptional regulator, cyclic AMP receptor protein